MFATRVQYTVRPEYVETNKANIQAVMAELRALGDDRVRYSAWLADDGQTFVHFVTVTELDANKVVPGLAAFKAFGAQLRASKPLSPPDAQSLTLVDGVLG